MRQCRSVKPRPSANPNRAPVIFVRGSEVFEGIEKLCAFGARASGGNHNVFSVWKRPEPEAFPSPPAKDNHSARCSFFEMLEIFGNMPRNFQAVADYSVFGDSRNGFPIFKHFHFKRQSALLLSDADRTPPKQNPQRQNLRCFCARGSTSSKAGS